ncbi:aminotransferase class IV [Lacibacter sediminis]|uniref:branched-chain-amino-acid transaminase n=1 Tax=Lacibacter sediminis TaxID=2760713 RepID=A0A7G5XGG1_9BACT|nr:aminotransferase class IV [Lacibacter sediminis]QNA44564.1 aminotransferase class IV [Lacibacter sediminis]
MWAFINNQFVTADQAVLPVSDLSIQRGYGIFDFFRTVEHVPLFIDHHLVRLQHSASVLRLQLPFSNDELKNIVRELINKNNLPTSGIRITVTGGNAADTYTPTTPNIVITQSPLTMDAAFDASKGLHLITEEYVRELPTVKSINYLMGIYLQQKVKDAGADDVLYVKNGHISELVRSNVFAVTHQNELITSDANVLYGITRKHILQVAAQTMGEKEQAVSLHDVLHAKEVFVSSTTKRLLPVFSINGNKIGNGIAGTVTTDLYQRFLELEHQVIGKGW